MGPHTGWIDGVLEGDLGAPRKQRLSSASHESMASAYGSRIGDLGGRPTSGGLSERSPSLRYLLTVG